MAHRPLALTVLGTLQFAAFAVGCVVLLGDGTLDGELSVADVALAVGVALVGALVVGSTWSGGRLGWWFELLLAVATIGWGLVLATDEDPEFYALPVACIGVLWLAIVVLPQARAWFLRPLQ